MPVVDDIVEPALGHRRLFLVADENDLERAAGALPRLGHLGEQVGEHRDVTQAVGHAPRVEHSIVSHVELERVALPALGLAVGRHHVEVSADEANGALAGAPDGEHEAGPLLEPVGGEGLGLDEALSM